MRRFTVEVRPPIAIELWNPQYPGDIPRWHFCVEARSEGEAVAIMARGDCKGMPMRVVPPLG
jgi:hypothetical protein